jgi:hypothetical protein
MREARAEARAKRLAEAAERQRQIELVVEVKRLAREAVLYSIRAANDKVSLYKPAEKRCPPPPLAKAGLIKDPARTGLKL